MKSESTCRDGHQWLFFVMENRILVLQIDKLISAHIAGLPKTLGMHQYDRQYTSSVGLYEKLDLEGLKDLSRKAFVFYLTDPYITRFWRIVHMEQYSNPRIYTMFRKIFMNGTLIDGTYIRILKKYRNHDTELWKESCCNCCYKMMNQLYL